MHHVQTVRAVEIDVFIKVTFIQNLICIIVQLFVFVQYWYSSDKEAN